MGVRGLFKKYRMTLQIVFAVIGISVGVSACIAFAVKFNNLSASLWAGISAIFAFLTLYVHISVKRDVQRRELQSSSFGAFMVLGALGLLAGLTSFITYIVIGKVRHEKGRTCSVNIVTVFLSVACPTVKV